MTTLVVGATGATGRLLVEQLRSRGQDVRVMAELITNEDTWSKWKGHMPVIYNKV